MLSEEVGFVDCMDIIIIKITSEMVTCDVNGSITLLFEKKKTFIT